MEESCESGTVYEASGRPHRMPHFVKNFNRKLTKGEFVYSEYKIKRRKEPKGLKGS